MQATNTMPNTQALVITDNSQQNYQWIMHPVIDLLLCCGGIIWLAAILMLTGLIPDLTNNSSKIVTNLAFGSFLLFVMPHQLATYLRVYDIKSTRDTMGKKVAILGVICLTLGILAVTSPFWASLVGRLTFAYSFQHFYAQAYGIALIYCYKRKYILSHVEKRMFSLLIQAGVWLGVLRMSINAEPSLGPIKLIRYWPQLPGWIINGAEIVLLSLAATFAFLLFKKWQASKQLIPMPAVLTILTAFFLFAYLPSIPNIGGALLVLYTIGHGFFHTPQYLVVTTAFHIKDRGLPSNTPASKIFTQLWRPTAFKYFIFLYSGAILLALGAGCGLQKLAHVVNGLTPEYAFFAYLCIFNLHHYWTDALIWRMKDKKTMSILLS